MTTELYYEDQTDPVEDESDYSEDEEDITPHRDITGKIITVFQNLISYTEQNQLPWLTKKGSLDNFIKLFRLET